MLLVRLKILILNLSVVEDGYKLSESNRGSKRSLLSLFDASKGVCLIMFSADSYSSSKVHGSE